MANVGEGINGRVHHGHLAEAAVEDLCRRCGRCCCVKIQIDGEFLLTPYLCPHLDPRTRLCTIYARRYELNPLCSGPLAGIQDGFWPDACAYADAIPGYRGPRMATPEEAEKYAQACEAIQDLIRQAAVRRLALALHAPPFAPVAAPLPPGGQAF